MSTGRGAFREVVVLFGDSLTQQGFSPGGFASRIADTYGRKADVLNRGFSGYTTRMAIHLLSYLFPEDIKCKVVTVCFGANDAATNERQAVPVEEFKSNLQIIVDHLKKVTETIVLVTPPPVDTARWPDRSNERVAKYASAIEDLSKASGTLFVNTYQGMVSAKAADSDSELEGGRPKTDGWLDFLNDGLHFSATGNEVVARMIMDTIKTGAPASHPEALGADFPWWDEVDYTAVGDAFTPEALLAKREKDKAALAPGGGGGGGGGTTE